MYKYDNISIVSYINSNMIGQLYISLHVIGQLHVQ